MSVDYNNPDIGGVDISIEISLREYGIAWKKGEKYVRIYYGLSEGFDGQYNVFDFEDFEKDARPEVESWVSLDSLAAFTGMDPAAWKQMPVERRVDDLRQVYGNENVFGYDAYPMSYKRTLFHLGYQPVN